MTNRSRNVFLSYFGNYIKCCKKENPSILQPRSVLLSFSGPTTSESQPWVQCVSFPAISLVLAQSPACVQGLRIFLNEWWVDGWIGIGEEVGVRKTRKKKMKAVWSHVCWMGRNEQLKSLKDLVALQECWFIKLVKEIWGWLLTQVNFLSSWNLPFSGEGRHWTVTQLITSVQLWCASKRGYGNMRTIVVQWWQEDLQSDIYMETWKKSECWVVRENMMGMHIHSFIHSANNY